MLEIGNLVLDVLLEVFATVILREISGGSKLFTSRFGGILEKHSELAATTGWYLRVTNTGAIARAAS